MPIERANFVLGSPELRVVDRRSLARLGLGCVIGCLLAGVQIESAFADSMTLTLSPAHGRAGSPITANVTYHADSGGCPGAVYAIDIRPMNQYIAGSGTLGADCKATIQFTIPSTAAATETIYAIAAGTGTYATAIYVVDATPSATPSPAPLPAKSPRAPSPSPSALPTPSPAESPTPRSSPAPGPSGAAPAPPAPPSGPIALVNAIVGTGRGWFILAALVLLAAAWFGRSLIAATFSFRFLSPRAAPAPIPPESDPPSSGVPDEPKG